MCTFVLTAVNQIIHPVLILCTYINSRSTAKIIIDPILEYHTFAWAHVKIAGKFN